MDQLAQAAESQFATEQMEVLMLEHVELLWHKKQDLLKHLGIQLLLHLPDHFQCVTETMAQMVSTAQDQSAMEQMDHSMDMLEHPAQEKSQLLSHTITPIQPLEDHTKPQVTLLPPTQLPQLSQLMLPEHQLEVLTEAYHQWQVDQNEK